MVVIDSPVRKSNQILFAVFLIGQIVCIVLYSQYVTFGALENNTQIYGTSSFEQLYLGENAPGAAKAYDMVFDMKHNFYVDVATITLIGLGVVLTILSQYSFTGAIFILWLACFSCQWGILMKFWVKNWINDVTDDIVLDSVTIKNGIVCSIATILVFATMMGKVSMMEMTVIAWFEMLLFAINYEVLTHEDTLNLEDHGALKVHIWVTYFGWACSFLMARKNSQVKESQLKNAFGDSHSHILSTIGTVFLWITFPSVNASGPKDPTMVNRAIINTVLALVGSTCSVFYFSKLFNGRVHAVDAQVCVLTGAVVISSSSPIWTQSYAPLLIGFLIGVIQVSTHKWGHIIFTKAGLDSCGVNNLNGFPGILGGIVTAIAVKANYDDVMERRNDRTAGEQAGMQLLGIPVSLAISVASGLIVGGIIILLRKIGVFKTVEKANIDGVEFEYEQDYVEEVEEKNKYYQ